MTPTGASPVATAGSRHVPQRGHSAFSSNQPATASHASSLFVVYWATSLASHLNIGHRHILPVYPVLFVAIGALGPCLDFRKLVMVAAIGALVLWHGLESARIRPHYLAYFNAIAGGPENGWRHLVDSSLDWGQDLPGLQAWLSETAAASRCIFRISAPGIRCTKASAR